MPEFYRMDFACTKCGEKYSLFTSSLKCRPVSFHCMECDTENRYPMWETERTTEQMSDA